MGCGSVLTRYHEVTEVPTYEHRANNGASDDLSIVRLSQCKSRVTVVSSISDPVKFILIKFTLSNVA